ncbi:MAG: 5'-nucleotidase C-terminal domain-containing protein [Nitrosopumilus sp.]|nr:5'-nucleotidase C-terminal domain-containing protein [Nitrosopumilus sp.]MDH3385399.1 5'-nucleotidase C-terminal domain-containing protein [Nitrosopumilus sp.]
MQGFFEDKKFLNNSNVICHLTDTYFIKESKIGEKIDLPGFARIFKILDLLSNKKENNILFLHSGDFLFPSFLSSFFKGKQIVDILNQCGLNYCTLGNHDFDGGSKVLKKRIKESKFKYIITNLSTPKSFSSKILNYDVWPRKTPIVAILGIAGKMTVEKAIDSGFRVKNLKNSLKKNMAEIREKFPDIKILIVLSHMGDQEDLQLKAILNKTWKSNSVIFGGHDHNKLISYNPKLDKCMLVKGKSNARTMQIINLNGIINKQNQNLEKQLLILGSKDFQRVKPSRKIEEKIESWFEKLKKQNRLPSNKIVKKFPKGVVLDGTESSLRQGSTNLGNFVTDCLKNYTNSDIALVNSGHFRCDRYFLEKLRVSDLFNIFVMEQKSVILVTKLSKKECLLLLKHAYSEVGKGKVLQVSKDVLDVLNKPSSDDKVRVAVISDMLFTDEDGFANIIAKQRKISPKKFRNSLKKDVLSDTNLIEGIIKTANQVNYDSKIRFQVGKKY